MISADFLRALTAGAFTVTATVACLHPHLSDLNGRERRREMMAQAARQRLARQLGGPARTSRRASRGTRGLGRGTRGVGRAWRTAAALVRLLPRYRAAR